MENAISPFQKNPELKKSLWEDLINCKVIEKVGEQKAQKYFNDLELWLCQAPHFTTVRVNTLETTTLQAKEDLREILDKQISSGERTDKFTVDIHPHVPDLLIVSSASDNEAVHPWRRELIVGALCGVAVLRGADVYAPGVMGAPLNLIQGEKVSVFADVNGMCKRGLTKVFTGDKVFVGNGISVMSRQDIFNVSSPSGLAVRIVKRICPSPSLNGIMEERLFLQNLPSVVCCHVLNPQPGDWVLDMCAAPGGKTTHLAVLMKNKGTIVALDKSKYKIQRLSENIQRQKFSNVFTFACDSSKALECGKTGFDAYITKKTGGVPKLPFPPELFDCILLDAPCSALGQRPQFTNSMSTKELCSFPSLQKKLFKTRMKDWSVGHWTHFHHWH
ncbi:putative methyltransferase NSUN6 isoform X2 [Limulus polyphemus]|uniref:Methyltransferase NSUN6 isoform X2 n=1 Tax=Limulus polyphemus TaxID=6850 RepID=A0ABM1SXZ8_LIMPO|nr:putative methyltransferase NSUN6 isoform X2 [Limulus polyphemus]